MEKIIPINTTQSKFFRQYLEILNPLLRVRAKELDVLAELLFHNNNLISIPEEHRWQVILGHDTKALIKEKLGMTDASLNNNLSTLRKKGIIKENRVLPNFLVYPKEEVTVNFQFNIGESKS